MSRSRKNKSCPDKHCSAIKPGFRIRKRFYTTSKHGNSWFKNFCNREIRRKAKALIEVTDEDAGQLSEGFIPELDTSSTKTGRFSNQRPNGLRGGV